MKFVQEGYACCDREAFVAWLLHGLPTLLPTEVTVYAVTDPSGRVAHASMVEPADAGFAGWEQTFARHIAEHPLIAHFQQTGDGHAIKLSDFLTQRQLHRLGLYHEFFRQVDVEHKMAIWVPVPSRAVMTVALHRRRRDFSERERLLLNLLRPHLVQAYANASAFTVMRQALEGDGQGVVLLTKAGRVQLISPRARQWLMAYFPTPARQAARLPEALRSWIRRQKAHLDGADDAPPPHAPLVVHREGARLVVRHLCEATHCLLLLEEQSAVQPMALDALRLTRREAEVLHWVAEGRTNEEIGVILGLSPRTVSKHLEHIYDKLGVRTRTAAVRLVVEQGLLRC